MSEAEIAGALRFLRVDDATRRELADFWPLVKQRLPAIMESFYQHLRQEPALMAMFDGQAAIGRAREAQGRHWERLFSGRFDADYAASVRAIAERHNRIGLEPKWYLGGYALVMEQLFALAVESRTTGWDRAAGRRAASRTIAAVSRAVMLDMEMVVTVYMEAKERDFRAHLGRLGDDFQKVIGGFTDSVAEAASALKGNADGLLSDSGAALTQAANAAQGASSASTNMQAVASAAEQMAASIQEINRQVAQTTQVTHDAVATVESTNATMRSLAEAAARIGEVVGLIQNIASQTNLLALNATIEAARAGEMGKGFAVVAGEVKNLSSQTARATDDIARQVGAIQTVATEAVNAIRQIGAIVNRIQEAASAIAGAVEEQGAVTGEISRSVNEAARGAGAVTQNVEQVRIVSARAADGARSVAGAAETLREQTGGLRRQSADFITRIKSGAGG
ncbi:MAG: globin-coupled sensor protein [Thalassobaculales bacterium]